MSRCWVSVSILTVGLLALTGTTGCAARRDGDAKISRVYAQTSGPSARTVRRAAAKPLRRVAAKAPLPEVVPAPPPVASAPSPAQEPQASCASSETCGAQLRAMLNDQSRSWIGKPQTADEHFTGTRQFAYLALLRVLKCQELAAGIKDMQAAMQLPPASSKFPKDRALQIKDLDAHVAREMLQENKARCPTAP